jgi:hypothetical protein
MISTYNCQKSRNISTLSAQYRLILDGVQLRDDRDEINDHNVDYHRSDISEKIITLLLF